MADNDEAIAELCGVVAAALNVPTTAITRTTGPQTLPQWDSFAHMHLMIAIEDHYKIEFDPEEIATMITVEAIARVLEGKGLIAR
jgi:acyl carrier protein